MPASIHSRNEKRRTAISTGTIVEPIAIKGMTYYHPPTDAVLEARDGRVRIAYGDLPIPLLDEDFACLQGEAPSYDTLGRGIYQALRMKPESPLAPRYARLLQEGYPHLLAELATNLLMLDKKDVETGYLDRKIASLKIFALLEPDNARLPLEIGLTYLEKGTSFSALNETTVTLYRAETYLKQSALMNPEDAQTRHQLGEVLFLLGKYDACREQWESILASLPVESREGVEKRLQRMARQEFPRIPVVDYLQALGVAMEAFEVGDFEEAAAIIQDVLNDELFSSEYPMAEIHYLLGLCYLRQEIPRYAEECFQQALALRPDYAEAEQLLKDLVGAGG